MRACDCRRRVATWADADAKAALGWRTHQPRETKHIILALRSFRVTEKKKKMDASLRDIMATFTAEGGVFIWCAP